MATTSTDATMTQIRTRLLTYTPPSGATLSTRIGGRLFKDYPGDIPVFPYAIMRLINQISDGAYNGERSTADLELMLFSNNRANAGALEDAADVCDMAMLSYKDATSGLVFSRRRQRDTLPPPADPAMREVVQIRLVYPVVIWSSFMHTAAS